MCIRDRIVAAHAMGLRHVRVIVIDGRTEMVEFFDQLKAGTFPNIIHIRFVSQSQHQNATSVDALAALVQGNGDLSKHVMRHVAIDLAGQLDETGRQSDFAGFPGEIIRIDWDAMPAQARAGIRCV